MSFTVTNSRLFSLFFISSCQVLVRVIELFLAMGFVWVGVLGFGVPCLMPKVGTALLRVALGLLGKGLTTGLVSSLGTV